MRLRGLRRFVIALAVLPLVGGVGLASVPAMFLCRGDQVARATCCCPAMPADATPSSQIPPTVAAGCCCDVSQANAPESPVAEPRLPMQALEHPVLMPLAGADVVWSPPSAPGWAASKHAQAPPRSIPILLGKQSLLV
jgi:hypothetical protein